MNDSKPGGQRIIVLDENGRQLFRGTIADSPAPWMFWHRVIPDNGFIDLPPRFAVVAEHGTAAGEERQS